MRASLKRKKFFIFDCFLIAGVILFFSFTGGESRNGYIYLYLPICVLTYLFFLFLFSALFINLNYQRFNLDENFRALAYGFFSATLAVMIYSVIFLKPHQVFFASRTIFIGISLFAIIGIFRYLEWKYIWPNKRFTAVLVGDSLLLKLHLEDIILSLRDSDKIIVVATENIDKSEWPFSNPRIDAVTIEKAYDIINFNRDISSVVLGSHLLNEKYANLLSLCHSKGLNVIELEMFYEMICRKLPLFPLDDRWVVYSTFTSISFTSAFVKRTYDIILSLAFLAFTLPFWALISLFIKLDSEGPVFFKQKRVGYNGKLFTLLKFRTMHPHEDDSDRWPNFEREMVTPLGNFLRRSGLDELPQLINILKGEMSFVGPRPARPPVTKRHISKVPLYSIVMALRPGVTGWAQIHQGQDTGDETLLEKVKYNLYYAKNNSLFLDLEIMLKTVKLFLLRNKPKRGKRKNGIPYGEDNQSSRTLCRAKRS